MTDRKLTVNPAYVVGQFTRALASAERHPDAAVRGRASERARQWRQVIDGMISGSLGLGSRTPVEATPAWATLEVAHGGFATGSLLAGGALKDHETVLLERLDTSGVGRGRTALNLYYLGDAGREELTAALESGCYRINVPEEGALPTVAWLVAHGAPDLAQELLDTITPFFDRLRFYPVPNERALVTGTTVRLQPIGKTADALRATRQQPRVMVMNEALTIWAPLYDRAVALLLETVEGPAPSLRTNDAGQLVRRPDGQPYVDGGWPCRTYPAGWSHKAQTLLEDYRRERAAHSLSTKPEGTKENFARLRAYIERAVVDPSELTGRDVGMIRKILAAFATRRGAPGSAKLANLRAKQVDVGSRPTHGALRRVVLDRLAAFSPEDGVPSLDVVGAPVTEAESSRLHLGVGQRMPSSVMRKLQRSLEAPVEELVQRGVIPSSESLGLVLPQMTSRIRAAGIADPALRRLYAAVYAAFRRRRSLLLLNLEHQVELEELPWIRAMSPFRERETSARETALETLRQLSLLAVTSFPQTILPNKLLQELRALATSSDLSLPLVEELAADIFMGEFSEKFLRAARASARLLEGSLYERYYGVSFAEVLAIDDVQKAEYGAASSPSFAALCRRLARAHKPTRWSVARNGTIIEQQQILTTHNLATLVAGAGLEDRLRGDVPDLARRCFVWVCRQQQLKRRDWRAQLQMLKNTAYAWRQMLFFLSIGDSSVEELVRWAEEHFERQPAPFRARFGPATRGLRFIAGGGRFDDAGVAPDGGRRFLGWTTESHWALGPDENENTARST
ncbi:MAG: hypothetical protein JWP97_1718 [Labilithrix sp.]|nr:hypothetical protein [Labilithrix sp.]